MSVQSFVVRLCGASFGRNRKLFMYSHFQQQLCVHNRTVRAGFSFSKIFFVRTVFCLRFCSAPTKNMPAFMNTKNQFLFFVNHPSDFTIQPFRVYPKFRGFKFYSFFVFFSNVCLRHRVRPTTIPQLTVVWLKPKYSVKLSGMGACAFC